MPPSAASSRPAASRSAPVKAPRAWPKSSFSASAGGSPAQSTTTKDSFWRGLAWCTQRASRPLPVPVSPFRRIGASEAAARARSASRSPIARLSWTSSAVSGRCGRTAAGDRAAPRRAAGGTPSQTSTAPALIASTASAKVAPSRAQTTFAAGAAARSRPTMGAASPTTISW